MGDGCNPYRQFGKEPSWSLTLVIQVVLCLGLYAAFNIGKPQEAIPGRRESMDLYFLSVRGGSRPQELQTQLLHQMGKIAKTYKAKFVLVVGELGEEDPLWHNATLYFPFLKIPWYTTKASNGQIVGFLKKIKIPHQQVLEIIGLNTRPLLDFLHMEQKSKFLREQISWLQQTLALSNSKWRVVVGFDPLMVCNEDKVNRTERIKFYEPLRHIFLKYEVNAYLSTQGCAGYFYHDGATMYIGNPGPADETHVALSASKSLNFTSELQNGFLLHRVSPLEIESYLIDSEGRVALKSIVHNHGRGAI
ncbi:uncharacterized protein [Typha angustifolia]|uniref:uncharacterized protein n=1 Tax=Typha angustifolia TaxID=59011 RepID=UPI003C2D67EF